MRCLPISILLLWFYQNCAKQQGMCKDKNLRLEYCTLLIAEIRKTIQDRKDLKQKGMCAIIEE